MNYRPLTSLEIERLKENSCSADDWARIHVLEGFEPSYVQQVEFSGDISLGRFEKRFTLAGGLSVHAGIFNARLHNVTVDNDVYIRNIENYIANYHIGEGAYIEHVNLLVVDEQTTFGNGVRVAVMNEGGGREVPIFDGLSAQLAYLLTAYRYRKTVIEQLTKAIDVYAREQQSTVGTIGKNVRVVNCGVLKNVRVGNYAILEGVSHLSNGTVNSAQEAPTYIGTDVVCDDFIVASGARIADATLISRCFVGQGCLLDKQYSALDSLFFANSQGLHGEATAVFAGPYTVSHHKSTLLIAGMFSFFNAGSGFNQSNHMYKLGPLHQGILGRGSKTASDSYLLWPAHVGMFTLVMGRHTQHADTSKLPFSYLIEQAGKSYLVPGANLRSVGTIRDAQKWPKRDTRTAHHKIDQINFSLLNPYTVQKMIVAISELEVLKTSRKNSQDEYQYKGCVLRHSSLLRGESTYKMAILKFLGGMLIQKLNASSFTSLHDILRQLTPTIETGVGDWCDLAGLLAPMSEVERLMQDVEKNNLCSLESIQTRFEQLHANYDAFAWTWTYHQLQHYWGKSLSVVTVTDLINFVEQWRKAVVDFDQQLYDDAKKEFSSTVHVGFGLDGHAQQVSDDFEAVRGAFETHPFVEDVLRHKAEKSQQADDMIVRLKTLN
ncbi:MAG TPA: DUF4954 family protein [Paludibacteraceae bacterium]|nr:DUF4954 family protein [Paludibacteraceae bacterium]HRS67749.1 DUF4954 family protein [Paludibacteraceae bacterium]